MDKVANPKQGSPGEPIYFTLGQPAGRGLKYPIVFGWPGGQHQYAPHLGFPRKKIIGYFII